MDTKIKIIDSDRSRNFIDTESYEHLILPIKTHEAVAQEYNIHVRTLRRWCIREGLVIPQCPLAPKFQRLIYETFGTPPLTI